MDPDPTAAPTPAPGVAPDAAAPDAAPDTTAPRPSPSDPHHLREVARRTRRPVMQLRYPGLPDEEPCAVCLEPLRGRVYHLPCSHTFHVRCLVRWRDLSGTCPMCRAPVADPRAPDDYDRLLQSAGWPGPPPLSRQPRVERIVVTTVITFDDMMFDLLHSMADALDGLSDDDEV